MYGELAAAHKRRFARISGRRRTISNFNRDSFIWALVYSSDYNRALILSMKAQHEAPTVGNDRLLRSSTWL